jgi:integrase
VVAFADLIVPDLQQHLDSIDEPSALAFTSPNGMPLRHSNFYRRVWMPALKLLGLVGVHIQDLRHAGNQLAAGAGASLQEMMTRMGHDSTRAALIYQHSTTERQRAIADQVSRNARAALGSPRGSGTQRARRRGKRS